MIQYDVLEQPNRLVGLSFISSVRSSYSHPDLLLITPLFQITPVLNTGLSLSKPLQLYKGYHCTQCAGFMDASWVRLGSTNDDLGTSWALPGQNLERLWHILAHSG